MTSDTLDTGMRRVLISGELRLHYRMAGLAAKADLRHPYGFTAL